MSQDSETSEIVLAIDDIVDNVAGHTADVLRTHLGEFVVTVVVKQPKLKTSMGEVFTRKRTISSTVVKHVNVEFE